MPRAKKTSVAPPPASAETQSPAELKPGYIADFISGHPVKDTPEERDAVQVFARRLVEDYGYPKEFIQTRPQHRVRKRPSDEEKSYPVDIGVFRSGKKLEDDLFLIVECKQKTRKDGIAQLKLYLDMSAAEIGVWFNGDEHEYLRKIYHKDGSRTYEALPNIPRHGQRIEDIGLFKRKDLNKPSNLKAVFRDLRNHLAGMTTGITRDEALAQEIINILFCKILDEQNTDPEETVRFRAGLGESAEVVRTRICELFDMVKQDVYQDVFAPTDTIHLDVESVRYVVGELQNYCVMDADRDAIGDAFEVFIGPALRGAEGQFFTPRNVVKMVVDILDPKPGEKIIDPACGSGGFLIGALEHVWRHIDTRAERAQWSRQRHIRESIRIAMEYFRGVDKDTFLAKVCKAYMALIGDGRGGVFCANSLQDPAEWPAAMQEKITPGTFDVVLTNPPFGKNIVVKGAPILSQFDLGHRWKKDRESGIWERLDALHEDQPPQILFIERCLQLLKPGGRLGIVLPEAVFGMPTYEYVVAYLQQSTKVLGVVSMPEPLFKTSGKGGTHAKVCVLFLEKTKSKSGEDWDIFMAEARWCGHDSRGNPTIRTDKDGREVLLDDVPLIAARHRDLAEGKQVGDLNGFRTRVSQLKKNIFIAKYYDPKLQADLKTLARTHDLLSLERLIREKILVWDTGIEVGKMAYGTGPIPFIRTSDISNWELKGDPKQGVSEVIYEDNKQDVQAGDIFVVRDGTYLVGTSCILTAHDTKILYCGGIYKLRVCQPAMLDPYLLLTLLNTPIVRRQMRSKQFTRDIIDTLGKRLFEVVLPVPKDAVLRTRIAEETHKLIETRVALRNRTKQLPLEIEGAQATEFVEENKQAAYGVGVAGT
ncbi:MAG: N-6 DNA methylase [Opitutaceae bacterium]|nr:N-6 DNA methylase [Opitutaceae bacterium]